MHDTYTAFQGYGSPIGPKLIVDAVADPSASDSLGEPRDHRTRPTAYGCTKDTDCKGDRICENGKCVSPERPKKKKKRKKRRRKRKKSK